MRRWIAYNFEALFAKKNIYYALNGDSLFITADKGQNKSSYYKSFIQCC